MDQSDQDVVTSTSPSSTMTMIFVILGITSFSQMLIFAIYDSIVKFTTPQSTTHFTRLSGLLCGSIFGIFISCFADASNEIYNMNGTSQAGSLFMISGNAISLSLFALFVSFASNPLMAKTPVQVFIQNSAMVASALAGISILGTIAIVIYPDSSSLSQLIIYIITGGIIILVCVSYIWLYIRRLQKPLRNPRGNENSLCTWGIISVTFAASGIIVFIAASAILHNSQKHDFTYEITLMISRIFMNFLGISMIKMKFVYNQGLMRNVGGKITYSRGYSNADGDDYGAINSISKPTLGAGTII